jgi:hypothetical protein
MEQAVQFNRLYKDISESLESAQGDLSSLNVDNQEGKEKLSGIVAQLTSIKNHFDQELELLQENAEWEHFVIAFFGETNAGKSTIIESLRILFNEESRQNLINENVNDFEVAKANLEEHVGIVKQYIEQVILTHTEQYQSLQKEVLGVSDIVLLESSQRVKNKNYINLFLGLLLGSGITSACWMIFGG